MLNWNEIRVQCHSRAGGNLSLWPSRLVYDAEVPEVARDVQRTIRDTATEQADYKKRKAELIPFKEAVNQTGGNLNKAIEDYSQYIQSNHFDAGLWPFTDWKTFVFFELDELPSSLTLNGSRTDLKKLKEGIKKLKGDSSASPAIPSEIDNLITPTEYTEDFQEYRDALRGLLTKIEERITAYEEAMKKAAGAQEAFEKEVLQPHGQNLVTRHEVWEGHLETRTGFEAEPAYQRLEGKFDLALRDPELSMLGDRQMRQLFFSILGQNTEGFKDTVDKGFLLGQNFGSEWQENRRNFPFLYNEWLKHNNVDEREAAAAETVVRGKEAALKARGLTTIKALIQKETSGTGGDKLIDDSQLKDLGPEPGKPGAPALDKDLLTYHRGRKEVIADLRYQYLRLATRTEEASGNEKANKAKAADYRQRAEKLQLFIDLEEAQITLYEWKTKEDAKRLFTRAELTKPIYEQWLLEVAMRQFVRAANMVDYPMGKQGKSQADMYHPAVRRMMIAMIMNEGTARWTADDKYDDNIADEYAAMLPELAKSNDFNINLRGKFFLNESARNYLLLARYSNLIRVRIPELRKEVEALAKAFDAAKKAAVLSRLGVNLDDPALTFEAAKTALEAKLLAGVDADFVTKFAAARAKIDGAAVTALQGLSINPDDPDPETQKAATEQVLINAARVNNLPAFTAAAGDRAKQIEVGKAWAKANASNPAATPALAAIKMLEYIDEFKGIQAEQTALNADGDKKLARAKELGASQPTTDFGLAFQTLNYLTKREALRLYEEDAKDIDKFIQDPNYRATRGAEQLDRAGFWKHLRERPSPEGPTENERILGDWTKYAQGVEVNYDLFDVQENSRMDLLDRMGISIKGVYHKYLDYIKANPDMRVDQWEKYLRSDKAEEFGKLVGLFRAIIPESEGSGKLDFLITFENWHKTKGREVTPENYKQNEVALHIYTLLAAHIQHEEGLAAASARGEMEVVAKMEGMNIGEKITKYGQGVLNLLIGPGQSLANRAAGMVLVYGAWKAARMAMKGDTTTGKGLRMLFLLGAAEIGMKEITGRGLIDRTHLFDTMSEAIEGTYEAVLVQRGIEGINEEQHTAALYELNTVPFHTAMQWYESTDVEGNPLPGQESDRLWKAMKVDVDRVRANKKVQWKEADETREARIIVKKTMEQFFGYVAEKDKSSGPNFAKEALKERWIKDAEDPNFTLAQAKYTHELPTELTDVFHGNQNALTWQMVMRAEIDPADVEKTNRQNWRDRVVDFATGKLAELERWGRQDILGWLGPAASNFWYELGVKADQVKTWLGAMGEAGATKLHFGRQYVEYWYEGNRHTIRRFMDDHLELVVDGLKLPFAVIYAADKAIVPWTTTKIRQIQEILREDKLTSTKKGGELQAQDIMAVPETTVGRELRDVTKNPEYRYFGEYQKSFAKAFKKPDKFEISEDPKELYHYRIGYHISAVTKEDVGYVKGTPPAEIMHKMQAKSWEKAREEYIKRGAPQEQVDKLMYPIHVIVQKGIPGAEEVPERMYVFWRMPMPGSAEYTLKTAPGNRWPDYMDPNKHKDRPPALFDPRLGLIENLEQALGLKLEGTRKVAGAAGIALSQALKLPTWTIEQAGTFAAGAIDLIPGTTSTKVATWLGEVTKMQDDRKEWLDERLSSAQSTDYALSKFYQDPVNAWWYRTALEYARDTQQDVWLGNSDIRWKGARQNTILMEQPSQFQQADFRAWLKQFKAKKPPPPGVTLPALPP